MTKRWYVLHVYSTFEQKVANHIEEQARLKGLSDNIGEILVPTVPVIHVKNGKKVEKESKLFPGYILISMEMNDECWHLVSSAPKVTGFLGSGRMPSPISDAEAEKIIKQLEEGVSAPASSISYEIGEQVRVIDGPFTGFNGIVEAVDIERTRLKVTVKVFERDTPCDVEYKQVEKIN
ncbi:MAG: transcription termination/antitermination protein NusG [Alphaproteobacteria bacterium]|nr:transcription termination/antitermination protein NusG [Alphaproteobacteria bacterium]